jgi:hypothetical protein
MSYTERDVELEQRSVKWQTGPDVVLEWRDIKSQTECDRGL